MRAVLAIALVLSSAAAPGFGAGNAFPPIEIGAPFPILALPLANDQDKAASIMEFRGRKLMLHLFASW